MSNYIGVRCPVCNKKFSESDDIVVCPICGAPHHRDCYTETNQCAFADDHLSGKEWHDPAGWVPPNQEANASKECARCGSSNPPDSIFCQVCGYPLALPGSEDGCEQGGQQQWTFPGGFGMQVDAISMMYGGLNPEEEIDGESVRDIARYIGNGSAYYLPRFKLMSESGRSFMPNLSAFVFNFCYYFYRKMYFVGGILLALYIISCIPAYLYAWEVTLPILLRDMGIVPSVEINQAMANHYLWLNSITKTINMAIVLIFSMFANRIYYNKMLTAVHNIRHAARERDENADYSETLAKSGGTSKVAVIIVVSASAVAYFIVFGSMIYSFIMH